MSLFNAGTRGLPRFLAGGAGNSCRSAFSSGCRSASNSSRHMAGGATAGSYDETRHNQVYVSQSQDSLTNVALEGWVTNNMNLDHKNILVLSNNVKSDNSMNIKASFLGEQCHDDEHFGLVLSSLPSSLPLSNIPQVSKFGYGSVVELGLGENIDRGTVCQVMESIGHKFLNKTNNGYGGGQQGAGYNNNPPAFHRLSLVRPDDGWFPGIEGIREDLATNLAELEQIQKQQQQNEAADGDQRRQSGKPPRNFDRRTGGGGDNGSITSSFGR